MRKNSQISSQKKQEVYLRWMNAVPQVNLFFSAGYCFYQYLIKQRLMCLLIMENLDNFSNEESLKLWLFDLNSAVIKTTPTVAVFLPCVRFCSERREKYRLEIERRCGAFVGIWADKEIFRYFGSMWRMFFGQKSPIFQVTLTAVRKYDTETATQALCAILQRKTGKVSTQS